MYLKMSKFLRLPLLTLLMGAAAQLTTLGASAQSPVVTADEDTARGAVLHQFSIQQALEYGKKNNVQVKNALIDVQVQRQTNREVTGSAYPQISGSANIVYNAKLPVSLVPAEFFGGAPGTFQQLAFGVPWGATYGLNASQILFDGQIFTGLAARKTLIDFQVKNVEVTDQLVRTNIYKIYYQLVVGKTQLDILDSNIVLLRDNLRDTRLLYENGFAAQLAVDRADVQLANLQSERISVHNGIQNGYLGLKVLMGMPIRDSLVLTDTLSDEEVKDGVLEAADFSYTNRPDFQYSQLGVKLQEYDVQRYKRSKIPQLSVNGYYNRNAQRSSFTIFKGNEDWFDIAAFTLQLNVPIFSGFAVNSRIEKARLALRQTVNLQEQLKIQIDNEIQTARNNFTAAVRSLDVQKRNLTLAETVFNQTKKQFEVGTGSQTDINTAQADFRLAQNNYIAALYNAVIARIDFLKATGKI